MPLLKMRKLARNSSDGSAVGSEAVILRPRAEKRTVGRRMLNTLNGCIGLKVAGTKGAVTHPTVNRELFRCAR